MSCFVFRLSPTDLQIYFNTFIEKSKEKFIKKIFLSKNIIFEQKMLETNIFTINFHFSRKFYIKNGCVT